SSPRACERPVSSGAPRMSAPHRVALGVAGGTGSGKTSVAHSILERVGGERIAFLAQDSYYKNVDWQKQGDLVHHNFDHPASLDTDLLAEHVRMLKAGRAVDV